MGNNVNCIFLFVIIYRIIISIHSHFVQIIVSTFRDRYVFAVDSYNDTLVMVFRYKGGVRTLSSLTIND